MVTSEFVFSSFQLTNLEIGLVYRNQSAPDVINDVSSDGVLQFVFKVFKIWRNSGGFKTIKKILRGYQD